MIVRTSCSQHTGGTPRVLQVVLSLNPGGTERLVLELVTRLHPEIPMAVCCLDEHGDWAASLQRQGIDVSAIGRTAGFQPALGRAIAHVAQQHRANVLHCHHYSPFVYGALARVWRPALRLVFTEHGRLSDATPSSKRRFANAILGRFPDAVFTVSADLREHIVAEGFAREAVQVIYNGIQLGGAPEPAQRQAVRTRLNVSDDTFVVGTVARLDPVKSLGTLIQATANLAKERPVALVIVGDGPERAALERAKDESGACEHVCFLGHRDDAREWLSGFDVYVNSSISEGVSLTILEAMAARLPIIATAVGGTPEVVTPDCGHLVPARDARAITERLRDLAGDPGLRQRLGANARRRVEELFTIERMVRDYRDVYCEVA